MAGASAAAAVRQGSQSLAKASIGSISVGSLRNLRTGSGGSSAALGGSLPGAAASRGSSDHPHLVGHGGAIWLVWRTEKDGILVRQVEAS